MAVALSALMPTLRWSLNVPGETGFFNFDASVDDEWIGALASGFWWAHLRGFFANYRVTLDELSIENVVDPPVELDRKLQQVIVLFTAMNAIEAKLLALPTHIKDSAKPGLETEEDRSAQLLRDLLAARRSDLQEIKLLLVGGVLATEVAVIDMFLAREAHLRAGTETYVLG